MRVTRQAILIAGGVALATALGRLVVWRLPATMPAVRMTVVDDRDGAPMPSVVALFWNRAHEGTLTGHGGRSALLFTAEAVSGPAGELRLPAQRFQREPFLLNTHYESPSMLLLQPGYEPLVLFNSLVVPTLAEASRWDHDGETVRMRTATDEELARQAYTTTQSTNAAVTVDPTCAWKRVPHALVAADRMFPNADMTTLKLLLDNDAFIAGQGCGSPKAFFAPYLRQ